MEFDWDPAKDAANLQKHGISFVDASTVFADPSLLVEDATKSEFREQRSKAIGTLGPIVVTVIFIDRAGQRRIISARRARTDERRRYDQDKASC